MATRHTCQRWTSVGRETCSACCDELFVIPPGPTLTPVPVQRNHQPPSAQHENEQTRHQQMMYDHRLLGNLGQTMPPSLRWAEHRFSRDALTTPEGHLDNHPYPTEIDTSSITPAAGRQGYPNRGPMPQANRQTPTTQPQGLSTQDRRPPSIQQRRQLVSSQRSTTGLTDPARRSGAPSRSDQVQRPGSRRRIDGQAITTAGMRDDEHQSSENETSQDESSSEEEN